MKTRDQGFTLLEVLVAIAILSGGILLLGSSWSGNLMRIRKASLFNNVSSLLEKKMIELEAEYRDKPLNEIPENRDGDFGSDGGMGNYKWKMKSRDLKFPDMASIIIGKGDADDSIIMMIRQMTDILSKSIKEIKVTVIVKTKKKDLEYSVTDYMIDYNAALTSLPGAGGGAPGAPGAPQQQPVQQPGLGGAPPAGGG